MKILYGNKLFLSCFVLILSFLYAFPIGNKIWHAYDEGWILVNADLISEGSIPNRDFRVLRPPGQFYILSLLFKVFGKSLMIGRTYTIVIHALICLIVFLITSKLCRLRYAFYSWFICTVSLVPRLGAMPCPVWSAMFLALLSLMTLLFYIKRRSYFWLIITGCLVSLVFLFRHDIGIYTLLSESITVFFLSVSTYSPKDLFSLSKLKKILLESILFLIPTTIVSAAFIYYFTKHSALNDMFYQLFYFPLKIYPQTRSIPFPKFCFNPNMLFHQSMYFMTVNQLYIPIFILFAMFFLFIVRMFRQRRLLREDFILLALSLTGLFYLNFIRVRTGIMHLVPILPVFLILFGFLISRIYEAVYFYRHKYLRKAILIVIFIFMGSFVIKNVDNYTKHTLRKPLQGKIKLVEFELGNVYIPEQDAYSVKEVVSFVRSNTANSEKIFIGNTSHVETQGNDVIIYFLSQRLPATKYHMFEPGVTDQAEIQKEMIESIEREVNLIVLVDVPMPKQIKAREITCPLDNYIKREFILIKNIGRYYIYRRKG